MSKTLERFKRELGSAWRYINNIDWTDHSFSSEKAYVCALFSKTAYLEIPEFEVKHHSGAKVIPCLTYQELVSRRTSFKAGNLLREADLGNSFAVVRNGVVAVCTMTGGVIFIALRGTRLLHISDWMTDLRIALAQVHVGNIVADFHSGFYTAVQDCFEAVAREIALRQARPAVPVYVVGHSLGGAMAGVAFGLDGKSFHSRHHFARTISARWGLHSAYSFGMPRYGGKFAVHSLGSPLHVYNREDLVPGLPPRNLGYEEVPEEYCLHDGGRIAPGPRVRQGLPWLLSGILSTKGVRYHLIERYIRRLGASVHAY